MIEKTIPISLIFLLIVTAFVAAGARDDEATSGTTQPMQTPGERQTADAPIDLDATTRPAGEGPLMPDELIPRRESPVHDERVLLLVADGVNDLDFFYVWYRCHEDGFRNNVAGPNAGLISGLQGYPINVAWPISELETEWFQILVIPGGPSADVLSNDPKVLELVRTLHKEDKIIAAVGRGVRVLAAAGILDGRFVTGAPEVAAEVSEAGGRFVDMPLRVDGKLITARKTGDLPALMREIVRTHDKFKRWKR
jgi:protease I